MSDLIGQKVIDSTSLVAVIGAGAMGAGIAQVAAQAGHKVLLFDHNEQAIFKAKEFIGTQLHKRVLKGKLSQENYDLCLENIIPTYSLNDLAEVDLVIEAIVENLEVKQTLFLELESICKNTCIFASNTSSISITSIASKLKHPDKFFGLHFFNPAPLMSLVEIICGLASDTRLVPVLYKTCIRWGKKPVSAKSTPGFIVNRVARPFYAEALRIFEEQAASFYQIDELFRDAGHFRMGPFELMDLIGHDVNYAVTKSVFDAYYQDPRFKPSLAQKSLVEAGFLGRKSGRGFYEYDEAGSKLLPAPSETVLNNADQLAQSTLLKRIEIINATQTKERPIKALIDRFIDANFYFDKESIHTLGLLNIHCFKFGDANLALSDGRSATERGKVEKLNNLITFDLAFDYQNVTRLAFSASDTCSEKAINDAHSLFGMLGIRLIQIDDIPGLVLMRTLAMLTNEAADTTLQGVANAEDIDTAMRYGVNYPEGPLSWGQRVGISYIHSALTNLHRSYSDDRYRPSLLLRRLSFSNNKFH